ncbi:hypothetical protein IGI37_001014 [Enterococcus sp. AZ194]|uniref:GNAT family N-acetyltransferase n=1 Tax=Enterococcus sp. AZ194 TaxID=2774629 RepID=UPI003F1EEF19
MLNYEIGNEEDMEFIETELDLFNKKSRTVEQEEEYKRFTVVAKIDGQIVGGGVAYSSLYYIGYIDTLWVAEEYRGQAIGANILKLLEQELCEYGCEMCHLDTFDFQAPSFYQKNGYEIFGKLHHKKRNITEFFLKKDLEASIGKG